MKLFNGALDGFRGADVGPCVLRELEEHEEHRHIRFPRRQLTRIYFRPIRFNGDKLTKRFLITGVGANLFQIRREGRPPCL